MSVALDAIPSMIDRIRHDLVGLKMPRALEALDHIVRRLERGELSALEAIDILLSEELTLRENSRIKTALRMGRLATIKTLAGFDFTFQPSLDRDRILTLAQLGFVDRHEAVHFLGPPGTGKSHLATALGVEAVKAGKSVYFTTLAANDGASSQRQDRQACRSKALPWSQRNAIDTHVASLKAGLRFFFVKSSRTNLSHRAMAARFSGM